MFGLGEVDWKKGVPIWLKDSFRLLLILVPACPLMGVCMFIVSYLRHPLANWQWWEQDLPFLLPTTLVFAVGPALLVLLTRRPVVSMFLYWTVLTAYQYCYDYQGTTLKSTDLTSVALVFFVQYVLLQAALILAKVRPMPLKSKSTGSSLYARSGDVLMQSADLNLDKLNLRENGELGEEMHVNA